MEITEEILNIIDPIFVTDQSYNIIYTNPSAKKLFNAIKITNKSNTNNLNKELNLNLSKIEYYNEKLRYEFKNLHYEITINSSREKNIFNFRNITQTYLEQKSNQINFISYLSHELRNPLQAITLSNYLLKTSLKEICDDKTNVKEQLEISTKSCEDMQLILDDYLDLAKLEDNQLSIEKTEIDLNDLLIDLKTKFKYIAEKKNIKLNINISKDINKLYSDPHRIHQILTNLVSNGLKYTNIGSVDISIECKLDNILFKVKDTGVGIEKEEIKNIFKKWGQTSNSFDRLDSNGLGLYLSQKIAHLLDGYIDVESEVNVGSIFTLYIPIKLENSNSLNMIKIYDDLE